MHQIVLRVLLLVVFFNTAVGMPSHAAEHLHGPRNDAAQVCADLHGAAVTEADDCAGDEHGSAHAQCVWCASHAQLATALASADVAPLPALEPAAVFCAAPLAVFVAQPERWRFAARDPPSLS